MDLTERRLRRVEKLKLASLSASDSGDFRFAETRFSFALSP